MIHPLSPLRQNFSEMWKRMNTDNNKIEGVQFV